MWCDAAYSVSSGRDMVAVCVICLPRCSKSSYVFSFNSLGVFRQYAQALEVFKSCKVTLFVQERHYQALVPSHNFLALFGATLLDPTLPRRR